MGRGKESGGRGMYLEERVLMDIMAHDSDIVHR